MKKINWNLYKETKDKVQSEKGARKFILNIGDEAIIKFNPGPDEPFLTMQHWIDGPLGKKRPIPCVQNDPRFENGCYACREFGKPAVRFAWNVVDTRWIHILQGPMNKKETKVCTKDKGKCEYCAANNKPFFAGACIWETSQEVSQLIEKIAQDVAKTCICGEELTVTSWTCAVCGHTFPTELSILAEEEICPNCKEVCPVNKVYSCSNEKPHEVRPRELEEVYLKIARISDRQYNITPLSRAIKEEHRLEPIALAAALLPASVADYAQKLGTTTQSVLMLGPSMTIPTRQLRATYDAIDTQFEDDKPRETIANPFED